MTFTYNLASTDEDLLNISRVRLELGDTVQGTGVRPDGTNLTDEEILYWLGEEDSDIDATVARAAGALSKMWTIASKSITVGPRREEFGDVAKAWADRAKESAADTSNLVVKIVPVDHKHNPYQVRPDEENSR